MNRHEAITRCYQIPGMCWPSELGALYDLFSGQRRHVEVGSYCGRSLFVTAMTLGMEAELFAIEPFIGCDSDEFPLPSSDWQRDVFYSTLDAIQSHRPDIQTHIIEAKSLDALRAFVGEATSIYIDANHHYAEVCADIQGWRSVLAPGGILAGHDYWPPCSGVVDAVNQFCPGFRVIADTRIWVASR